MSCSHGPVGDAFTSSMTHGPVRLIEERSKTMNSAMELVKLTELDRAGRVIREKSWTEVSGERRGQPTVRVVQYSRERGAVKALAYQNETQLTSVSVLYLDGGRPVMQAHAGHRTDGTFSGLYVRKMDQCQNAFEELEYVAGAPFFERKQIINQYRDTCRLRETTVTYPGGQYIRHLYDDNGRVAESFQYGVHGGLEVHIVNTFNDHGDVIETVTLDSAGETKDRASVTYEYDEHGNWISRVSKATLRGGEPLPDAGGIIRRLISYYEER
jgi:hypothetical protein